MASKNYCSIHHLYYSSNECPLCRDERTAMYAKKYGGVTEEVFDKETMPKKKNDRGINKEDITKLMEKFNCKVSK